MRAGWIGPGILAAAMTASLAAAAEFAVSSNDGHSTMQNGALAGAASGRPDTLSVIDLAGPAPRVVASIEVPGSVVGPPMAVAISPDGRYALVTAATKAAASAPGFAPDDRVSVVDLQAKPPAIVQQTTAGPGAAAVRFTPDGRLVLVANRFEGTVSVFGFQDGRLTPSGKVDLGNAKAGPSGIAVLPDGRTALLTRDGDSMVSVLHIEGATVTLDPRPITTAMKPYTLDINPAGTLAAVSNMGRNDGDIDSVSLIDLTRVPFRTIHTVSVGAGPEGLRFSPDGALLAVATQEGSTKPTGSPFRTVGGRLQLFRVADGTLALVAAAPTGHWSQGVAFSRDGGMILVQLMGDAAIAVFRWDGAKLTAGESLPMGAGPAAIAVGGP